MSNIALIEHQVTKGASTNFNVENSYVQKPNDAYKHRLNKYQHDVHDIERQISNLSSDLATEDFIKNQKEWEQNINNLHYIENKQDAWKNLDKS